MSFVVAVSLHDTRKRSRVVPRLNNIKIGEKITSHNMVYFVNLVVAITSHFYMMSSKCKSEKNVLCAFLGRQHPHPSRWSVSFFTEESGLCGDVCVWSM